MAEKVAKVGVEKESGYLYFIDKSGNIGKVLMVRGAATGKHKKEIVAKVGVEKESGYLYFVDKDGDVSRAKMMRGGVKRKKTTAKKK